MRRRENERERKVQYLIEICRKQEKMERERKIVAIFK
jgi:hypothetical protein